MKVHSSECLLVYNHMISDNNLLLQAHDDGKALNQPSDYLKALKQAKNKNISTRGQLMGQSPEASRHTEFLQAAGDTQ